MCVDSPWAGTFYDKVFHAIIESEAEFTKKTGIKLGCVSLEPKLSEEFKLGVKATGANGKEYFIEISPKLLEILYAKEPIAATSNNF